MCQRAFPGIFDLACESSFNWRTAPRSDIHKFSLDLFSSLAPTWLIGLDVLRAQRCVFSLSKTRPDKFETFYTKGNLIASTKGNFWLAANQILGSRWHMKAPSAIKTGNHKGSPCVNFHHALGATVLSNQAGIFLKQPRTQSGDCQEAIDVTTAVRRSHNTYVTISLPRCAPPSIKVFDQAVNALLDVLQAAWSFDTSILLYVFPTTAHNNPQARPIRPRTWREQPPDKTTLKIYASQVWLRVSNHPFL